MTDWVLVVTLWVSAYVILQTLDKVGRAIIDKLEEINSTLEFDRAAKQKGWYS